MRLAVATMRTALLEAWSNRRSFWLQVTIMITNDVAWVVFWILFFRRVGSVRGWDVNDVLVLFAVLTTAAGIALGLLANARRLGQMVGEGEIDASLTLPIPTLTYLLFRRVDTSLLGDLFFGPVLFLAAGIPTLPEVAGFIFGSICGAAVLVGFLVMMGSLTLFVGGRGEQADLGFQAILILASYPVDIFAGFTKLLLFTAIPAAFVTSIPVEVVRSPSLANVAAVAGAALLFLGLGALTFHLGLRRYSSGALWTRA